MTIGNTQGLAKLKETVPYEVNNTGCVYRFLEVSHTTGAKMNNSVEQILADRNQLRQSSQCGDCGNHFKFRIDE